MLILHVEDSATSRSMFAAQTIGLQPHVHVAQCASVGEARAFLVKHEPAFAVLDVSLPDGSGAEIIPLLRCPVVFVTADASTAPSGQRVVAKGPMWIRNVLTLMRELTKK